MDSKGPTDGRTSQAGSIEVICGPMFSGKTDELIRRLRAAENAGQVVQVFKPRKDNRYHPTRIVSHGGSWFEAVAFDDAAEITTLVRRSETVVGIDEAQLADDEIVRVVSQLAFGGVRAIVAMLDLTFDLEPFGQIGPLCALAEDVLKVKAVCFRCGAPASLSWRDPSAGTDRVVVGGKEIYQARCRRCYSKKD